MRTSIALLFPGQGSQSVGMLGALAERYSVVHQTFTEASDVLGLDLWHLSEHGPADQLSATEFTQPAMLAAGVATWRAWCAAGGSEPAAVAGHSLGEYTALVCAGALSFEVALRLVRYRGQLMQQACPVGAGAMAAVLGLDEAQLTAVCRESAGTQVVEPVNFNAPGQIVIAGHTAAVERALALAQERGARRTLRLPVSVPAHSSLMQEAAAALGRRLLEVELRVPRYPYVSAVDAREHGEPGDLRSLLARQLIAAVRWTDCVRAVCARAGLLLECGPGRVLTGLSRRIEREVPALALEDPPSLAAALEASRSPASA